MQKERGDREWNGTEDWARNREKRERGRENYKDRVWATLREEKKRICYTFDVEMTSVRPQSVIASVYFYTVTISNAYALCTFQFDSRVSIKFI